MAAEPLTLVTMRLTDLKPDNRVKGSVDGACVKCREPVSIGPQSETVLRKHRGASRVLCTVCVFAELAKEDPDREVELRATADAPRGGPIGPGTWTARKLADVIDQEGLST